MIIENHYEEIHPTDCYLKEPEISSGTMIISARNIGVMPGHPLNSTQTPVFLAECRLIYVHVKSSVRTLHEYIGDPRQGNFKPPRTIQDGPFAATVDKTTLFELEGVLENPYAWVDWDIECGAFYLEIP